MRQSIKFPRSITNHGGSLGVSIPKELVEYLGLKTGDQVDMVADCKSKMKIAYFYKA